MKKNEIVKGGHYTAKVNGKLTTVRVDRICEYSGNTAREYGKTCYDVTNLATGRKTTFRSAAKFRNELLTKEAQEACKPAAKVKRDADGFEYTESTPEQNARIEAELAEGEQGADPTPAKSAAGAVTAKAGVPSVKTSEDKQSADPTKSTGPATQNSSQTASVASKTGAGASPVGSIEPRPSSVDADRYCTQEESDCMDGESGDQCPGCGKEIPEETFISTGPMNKVNIAQKSSPTVAQAAKGTDTRPEASGCDSERTTQRNGHSGEQQSQPESTPGSVQTATNPTPMSGLSAKLAARQQSADGAPHVELKALAGTGKTTSCIEGLKAVRGMATSIQPSPQQEAFWKQLGLGRSDSVRLSAFNTTITDEMKAKVVAARLDKTGVEARGVHSLGLQAVTKMFGRQEANNYTVLDIAADLLGGNYRDLCKQPGMMGVLKATDDLVSLCKQNLAEPIPENLDRLARHYDVEMENSSQVYDLVPRVLERCKAPKGRIAFDDMVWLPLVLGLPVPKVDVQIIDEAQDLNRMQQELVYRGGHRVVFVGDPHQAIYGFAGADSESMPRMVKTLSATPRGLVELPLTVTRRCGKAIVKEAQRFVKEYEAHESNPAGIIEEANYPIRGEGESRKELPWNETYCKNVGPGDMILCRVNAPLVSQVFRFLKKGMKANILGRKIGDGLVSLVEKSKTTTSAQLIGWLSDWLDKELALENARKFVSENRLIALQDKHDCVASFAEDCQYTSEVCQKIKSIFTDDKDRPGIRLASMHKSKGLEARNVFILMPKGASCPHPMAKKAWQIEQENNLLYVAITRAIEKLTYVY